MNMYIEAVNLTKKYGNFYALRNLNLRVEGAKCVGYLGPNGAGKTTTLKLFTNLLRPTSGDAIINGYNVKKNVKKALADVGTLIETPNFYPHLTPMEILSMACELRGTSKRDIKDSLKKVRLYEWRNKKVGKFSKGMLQRLALASALVTNPEILILDEPTTGMDPQGMREIRDIIKELKKGGLLIFMSSHLLPEVTYVCDEVAMINRGRLILYDSIENVTSKFSSDIIVVEFLHPVNNIERIESIEGVRAIEVLSSSKMRIAFKGGPETQYSILQSLIKRGYKVVSFQSESLALEEAYLKLIGGDNIE